MVKEVEVKYTDAAIIRVTTLFSDALKVKEELLRVLSTKKFSRGRVASLQEIIADDKQTLQGIEKLLKEGYTNAKIVKVLSSGGLMMDVLRVYNGEEVLMEKGVLQENLHSDGLKTFIDLDAEMKDWELLLMMEMAYDNSKITSLKSRKFFKRF